MIDPKQVTSSYNNMAMIANGRYPFTFAGRNEEDPRQFMEEFIEYSEAAGWNEIQQKVAFKIALEEDARKWCSILPNTLTFEEIKSRFLTRFVPKNIEIVCIKELSAAKWRQGEESILTFLDRLMGIAKKGRATENILVVMALNALPDQIGMQLIQTAEELTWEKIYQITGQWEAMGKLAPETKGACLRATEELPVSQWRFRGRCHNCRREGHKKAECRAKKRKLNQRTRAIEEDEDDPTLNEKLNEAKFYNSYLNQKNKDNPCTMEVKIRGRPQKAILDTGSDLSLLDGRNIKNENLEKRRYNIKGAGGEKIKVKGVLRSEPIEIKKKKYEIDLVVCKNLNRECILGIDFIKKHGMKLTVKGNTSQIQIGSKEKEGIGEHRIDTGNVSPIAVPMYRQGSHIEAEIRERIKEYLKEGIIRKSESPWRAPIVMVPKKGTTKMRMCIDYRKLNEVTKKDKYPMPNIQEVLDALGGAKIFSKMDAQSGYHQVKIAEEDCEKTAFACKEGIFEFQRMPFGLVNAPATFQRIMDNTLSEFLWKFVVLYLDDVIVFSKSREDHQRHLNLIQEKLKNAGIILNQEKCEYFKTTLNILGHIITTEGIKPNPERVKAIKEFKIPETKKEIMSFLGLVGYCRKFIKDLSMKSKKLYELTRDEISTEVFKQKIKEDQILRTIQQVKDSIAEDALLALPNNTDTFVLTTDASCMGVGAVLTQIQDGRERAIEYFSSLHNSAQQRYSTTEHELLAVVSAIEHFRPYLLGRKFKLRTNHKSLTYLLSAKKLKSRIFRWALLLQEFEFEIEHIKGINNFSDVLSRAFRCNSTTVQRRERKLIIPKEEDEEEIIRQYHDATGHGGMTAMKYGIMKRYIFKNANKKINRFVRGCEICNKEAPTR